MKIYLLAFLAVAVPARGQTPTVLGEPVAGALPEGVVEARFGADIPTLGCGVLRACRVELQAGEVLLSPPALGDSERWLTVQIATGPAGAVPVIVVKPKACGIATNLVLATDRRIYDLDLEAAPCRGTASAPVRAVRFAYPEASAPAPAAVPAELPTLAERAAQASYTGYRWTARGPFPWTPTRVVDDGEHLYVELPPAASYGPAPVLYALEGGERTLINYATEGNLFVTDRVVGRAALVVGETSLIIERRGPRRAPALNGKGIVLLSALGGLVAGLVIGS